MPVNIVATPNAAIQTAVTEATGNETASNDDFANLLQDQLTANAGQAAAEALAANPPALVSNVGDAGDSSDASQTDGVLDPSALLATLALVTPAVNNDTTESITPDTESTADTALTALSAATMAGQDSQDVNAASASEIRQNAASSPSAAASDDATAKFAVAGSQAEADASRAATTAKLSSEVANQDISVDSADVHTNLHATSAQHPVVAQTSLAVATPVRDADWSTDLGQKVVWLASSDTQSAQLTLNPEHLGPIDVSVDIDNLSGSASVSFASANAEVRDALESAMPRLREMFASAGIELGQTNVGAESFRQSSSNSDDQRAASRSTVDNAILAGDTASTVHSSVVATQRGNGLVDLFA